MTIVINNNIPSMTAQRYLGNANDALAKSIEKLSSGLRINHASDDASGLAISEKLRSQINGVKRASLNIQDGTSMLQTAEGGLQNIQDMLQRMRELSVQASNDTYTSNDRVEIQKEIEELKSEINKTSIATEFNTKKLLNGNATALWSSDSDKVDVTIKSKVIEGNYNINISTNPGKNYIYNTDVMTLNNDAIGAEIDTSIGTTADDNDTNVSYVTNPNTLNATGTAYYTVTIGETSGTDNDTSSINGTYLQAGSSWSVSNGGTANTSFSGYIEIEFLKDFTGSATTDGYRYRTIDAKTGTVSNWTTGDLDSSGITAISSIGVSATITVTSGDKAQAGDKILLAMSDKDTVNADSAASGGGTITISGGKSNSAGPTIEYAENTLTKADDGDTEIDYNDVTVYIAELDETNGNLDLGNITLGFKEQTDNGAGNGYAATDTGDFRMTVKGGGEVATSTTKLKDLSNFTTADGINIFDTTQNLTIYGNNNSTTIYLEGDDTINDLEKKLTAAIVNDLEMGTTTNNVNNNLVNYVASPEAQSGTNESTAGTFVIQSALLGNQSQISFSGNDNLLAGLSVSTIQEGENSSLNVKVTNANSDKTISSEKINSNTLKDVIQGIDIKIANNTGVNISWDITNKKLNFTQDEPENFKLHLVDNTTFLQAGANEGQNLDISIPQIDTKSLNVDDLLVITQDLAEKSITKVDNALNIVSNTRATIGGQINRLGYISTGLEITNENLTAAESRIRDLDFAAETAEFTKQQILAQSATAMVAQANQLPQMVLKLLG